MASLLMRYTTPINSLMILNSLFENYDLSEWSKGGFEGLKRDFYVLISLQKKYLPEVFHKFVEFNYMPSMYAQTWFLTLFAHYFSAKFVSRIWDVYLVEGKKTILRIALAIMHLKAEELI